MLRTRRQLLVLLATFPLLQAGGLDCSQRIGVSLAEGFFDAFQPWFIDHVVEATDGSGFADSTAGAPAAPVVEP